MTTTDTAAAMDGRTSLSSFTEALVRYFAGSVGALEEGRPVPAWSGDVAATEVWSPATLWARSYGDDDDEPARRNEAAALFRLAAGIVAAHPVVRYRAAVSIGRIASRNWPIVPSPASIEALCPSSFSIATVFALGANEAGNRAEAVIQDGPATAGDVLLVEAALGAFVAGRAGTASRLQVRELAPHCPLVVSWDEEKYRAVVGEGPLVLSARGACAILEAEVTGIATALTVRLADPGRRGVNASGTGLRIWADAVKSAASRAPALRLAAARVAARADRILAGSYRDEAFSVLENVAAIFNARTTEGRDGAR